MHLNIQENMLKEIFINMLKYIKKNKYLNIKSACTHLPCHAENVKCAMPLYPTRNSELVMHKISGTKKLHKLYAEQQMHE